MIINNIKNSFYRNSHRSIAWAYVHDGCMMGVFLSRPADLMRSEVSSRMGDYPFYNLFAISRIAQDSQKGSFDIFSHITDLGR